MIEFTLPFSTKTYFGENIIPEALSRESEWIVGTIMIVSTGGSIERNGYLTQLVDAFNELEGVSHVIVFTDVSANPKLDEVKRAVSIGRQHKVSIVAGLGGGSALDAAKAVAAGIPTQISLEQFLLKGLEPGIETLPVIAIPTTAGTGSELSKGAIISSEEHHIKTGIRGANILPRLAIVDPVFTWSVPLDITMQTGFDVLAHGIETFMAIKSNLFSEMLSEQAIKTAALFLPLLKQDLNNHEARRQMSYASMLMGMNLANVGTCLPHRIQYAIGAAVPSTHAEGLLALYPVWIEAEFDVNKDKLSKVMQWMGFADTQNGQEARRNMESFINRIGQQRTLGQLGIQKEDLEQLTEAVTGNLANDRLAERKGILNKLLKEAL